jgi:hypothetical protein
VDPMPGRQGAEEVGETVAAVAGEGQHKYKRHRTQPLQQRILSHHREGDHLVVAHVEEDYCPEGVSRLKQPRREQPC